MSETTTGPNVANIRTFAEALRSGRYEQGKDYLKQDNAYCVWGLASEVSGKVEWHETPYAHTYCWDPDEWDTEIYPPQSVVDWLGVPEEEVGFLMERNDRGDTFEDLARYLERKYLNE